jgi:hypothetical protein
LVTGNYWDATVYATAPLCALDRSDESVTFDRLRLHFPVLGTKIDWQRVSGDHVHRRISDDVQLASVVSAEVCRRVCPGSIVEHVGDGLSPYGVRFGADNAASVVAALLEIPEHHYFLAGDRSWIVVVTFEGDLDTVDHLGVGEAKL